MVGRTDGDPHRPTSRSATAAYRPLCSANPWAMTTTPAGGRSGSHDRTWILRPRAPTKLASSALTPVAPSVLAHPHPWVEDRIEGIDDDVRGHDEEGGDEDDPDDDREVLHLDRLDHRESKPG